MSTVRNGASDRPGKDIEEFAFVSRVVCPSQAANTLQTLNMAAAIARTSCPTRLFVHDLAEPEGRVKARYGIVDSPLEICSLKTRRWPRVWYRNTRARFLTYNSAVAARLALGSLHRTTGSGRCVVFVRSRLEILYWGLLRDRLPWLRRWVFCCEVHDLRSAAGADSERMAKSLRNFDLVFAVTQGLAEDIGALCGDRVQVRVLPLCSALPCVAESTRRVDASQRTVILGYAGKCDVERGVPDLLHALDLLPSKYRLRLVGPIAPNFSAAFEDWRAANPGTAARVEMRPPVNYAEIAHEIDDFDIALLPAGPSVHVTRYACPLKLFDYWTRGKPIVAAQTPCHTELVTDGVDALCYRPGDAPHLADQIRRLAEQPRLGHTLSQGARRMAAEHTYDARATRMLAMIDTIR